MEFHGGNTKKAEIPQSMWKIRVEIYREVTSGDRYFQQGVTKQKSQIEYATLSRNKLIIIQLLSDMVQGPRKIFKF